MKIVQSLHISNQIELLYAKTTFKNSCKVYHATDAHFLELAVVELGSNLLKYTDKGYLWLMLINGSLAVASLDFGAGIDDIDMAKQKGFSSLEGKSLGIGLYALSSHEHYQLDILSFMDQKGAVKHGSVILVKEKQSVAASSITLSLSLYDSHYNGDFCTHKGRYTFFGDVSGHGKKADLCAKEAMRFFYETPFSSFAIEQFFQKLHEHLIEHGYRSLVGCIVEVCEKKWSIFGVGDIAIITKQNSKVAQHPLPLGIVAESYSALSSFDIERIGGSLLLLMSDGVNPDMAMEIVKRSHSISRELLAISILHFAGLHDDRTITILS